MRRARLFRRLSLQASPIDHGQSRTSLQSTSLRWLDLNSIYFCCVSQQCNTLFTLQKMLITCEGEMSICELATSLNLRPWSHLKRPACLQAAADKLFPFRIVILLLIARAASAALLPLFCNATFSWVLFSACNKTEIELPKVKLDCGLRQRMHVIRRGDGGGKTHSLSLLPWYSHTNHQLVKQCASCSSLTLRRPF